MVEDIAGDFRPDPLCQLVKSDTAFRYPVSHQGATDRRFRFDDDESEVFLDVRMPAKPLPDFWDGIIRPDGERGGKTKKLLNLYQHVVGVNGSAMVKRPLQV